MTSCKCCKNYIIESYCIVGTSPSLTFEAHELEEIGYCATCALSRMEILLNCD